jgi:hypothetical protein
MKPDTAFRRQSGLVETTFGGSLPMDSLASTKTRLLSRFPSHSLSRQLNVVRCVFAKSSHNQQNL